jgi:hypothetical protein
MHLIVVHDWLVEELRIIGMIFRLDDNVLVAHDSF